MRSWADTCRLLVGIAEYLARKKAAITSFVSLTNENAGFFCCLIGVHVLGVRRYVAIWKIKILSFARVSNCFDGEAPRAGDAPKQ